MYSFNNAIIEELAEGLNWPVITFFYSEIDFINDTRYNITSDQHIFILTTEFNEDCTKLGLKVYLMLIYNLVQRNFSYKTKIILVIIINKKLHNFSKKIFFEIIGEGFNLTKLHNVLIILTQISYHSTDLQRDTQLNLVHELYTWYPVWESENCGQFKEFVLLERWNNNDNKSFQYLTNHIPSKILKSFGECTAFYYLFLREKHMSQGLELSIIEALLSSLNLKLQYLEPDFDDVETEDIVLVKTGSAYINQFVTDQQVGKFYRSIVTFPHLFSDIRWFVPCPKRTQNQGKFYKVFDTTLWVLVILIFIVAAAITIIIHKYANTDYMLYNSTSYNLYSIWAIFTSVSVPRMPKTTIFRILFLAWLYNSIILSTIFQSFFTSFLIESGSGNQISDI